MLIPILRGARYRQPSKAVALQPKWVGRAVTVQGAWSDIDHATGARRTTLSMSGGTMSQGRNFAGLTKAGNGGALEYSDFPSGQWNGLAGITLVFVGSMPTSEDAVLAGLTQANANSARLVIRRDAGMSRWLVEYKSLDGGGGVGQFSPGTPYKGRTAGVFVARFASNDIVDFFVDGSWAADEYFGAGPTDNPAWNRSCIGGLTYNTSTADSYVPSNGDVNLFAVLRDLSLTEAAELSANPWSLFEPEEDILLLSYVAPIAQVFPGSYSTREAVNRAMTGSYAVKAPVSRALSGSYGVRSSVPQLFSASYGVQQHTLAQSTGAYGIQAPVQQLFSGSYGTAQVVVQTFGAGFDTKEAVAQIYAGNYALKQGTAQAFSGGFVVNQPVAQVFSAGFGVAESVSQVFGGSFSTQAHVVRTFGASYVLEEVGVVAQGFTGSYLLLAPTSQVFFGSYGLQQTVEQTSQGSYGIAGLVAEFFSGTYSIQQIEPVLQVFGANYQVWQVSMVTLASSYAVKAQAQQLFADGYTVEGVAALFEASEYLFHSPYREVRLDSVARDFAWASPERDLQVESPIRDFVWSSPDKTFVFSSRS